MKRPNLSELTLREKIGQTGFPGVRDLRLGVINNGGYANYFTKYPFTGLYVDTAVDKNNQAFTSPEEFDKTVKEAQRELKIPLFIAGDFEFGAYSKFPQLHEVSSGMAVGAANSEELAYKRAYYWARELNSFGVNWAFGPVTDMLNNFFDVMGTRCMSDSSEVIARIAPAIIKGYHDAGVADSPKHFPGSGNDYRDTHFCSAQNDMSREEWDATYGKIYQSVIDAGAKSIMISHMAFPAVDDSLTPLGAPRPATASKKVLDILRKDMNYDGVIVTDAVAMKGIASAFEPEDVYIECFNAGNDVVLFVHDDYIDVMERAVKDGRVSMERLDESVQRILDLKEDLGLFDEIKAGVPLTESENEDFEKTCSEVAKKSLTLINNTLGSVPFDPARVKKALVVAYSPSDLFGSAAEVMVDEFGKRGIEAKLVRSVDTKEELDEYAKEYDIIIYACYLAFGRTKGMHFFNDNVSTLFNAFSRGAEKSVAVSFGAPSIYYNYFENSTAYVNAYSMDEATMRAFVGAILGDFEFVGKSPVALKPSFAKVSYK